MLNLEALTFGFDYDIWMASIRATQTLTAPNAAHNDWAKNVNHAINFSQSLLVWW